MHVSGALPPSTEEPISPPAHGSSHREFHNYAAWTNVVLGLLVFTLRYGSPRPTFDVHWNLFLTGIVIMFAALATTIAHDEKSSKNYWSTIDIVAGVWLLVSAQTIRSIPAVTLAQEALGALVIAVALASLATEIVARGQRLISKPGR
jgi:multisubunit Na+/H+ antiporter MnhC subunit